MKITGTAIISFFRQQYQWVILLAVASVFRLIWAGDMEWKADEQAMFELAGQYARSGEWPQTGLKSGVGFVNSGMSIYPFILFYKISPDPVFMARCVMGLNVFALVFLLILASHSGKDRQVMMYGVALMAVNVLAVLFSRKIWAQDLLPVFTVFLWGSHFIKNRYAGVFLTGIFGAFAGQLHISGYFIAAGIFLTSLISGRYTLRHLLLFFTGFALAMIPAWPWIRQLFQSGNTSDVHLNYIFKFEYFLHALTDPFGLNVLYPLGAKDVYQFMKFPMLGGVPLFLPILAAGGILWMTLRALKRVNYFPEKRKFKWDLKQPFQYYFTAFVLIPGLLLTLSGSPVRSHYLIASAPFLHAGFAYFWLKAGMKNVWAVVVLQALITLLFLMYVHQADIISGDYGIPFNKQLPD